MVLIKTLRLVILLTPLLCGAQAQNRPGSAHPATPTPQNSKVRDKNWVKSQVRRRYGTSALPEKSSPNMADKKMQPDSNPKRTPSKN
jgi:hypothetical protein